MRTNGPPDTHNRHRVSFTKQVQEVIRLSDIILLVVDARMIGETRNPELEAMVKAEGKYLVHVVNKADLIDVKGFDRTQLEGLSYPVLVSYKSGIGLGKLRDRKSTRLNSSHT